jgi:hypothetical protein
LTSFRGATGGEAVRAVVWMRTAPFLPDGEAALDGLTERPGAGDVPGRPAVAVDGTAPIAERSLDERCAQEWEEGDR